LTRRFETQITSDSVDSTEKRGTDGNRDVRVTMSRRLVTFEPKVLRSVLLLRLGFCTSDVGDRLRFGTKASRRRTGLDYRCDSSRWSVACRANVICSTRPAILLDAKIKHGTSIADTLPRDPVT